MGTVLEQIKKAREGKGYSQTEVATKLGIGLRQYQNIEAGQFPKYKRQQIEQLENVLGIKVYEKIYEENVPRANSNLVEEPSETYLQKRQNIKLNGNKEVPVYGGFTSLGNIQILDDENIKHKVVAQLPAEVFPNCDYAEKAKGDSMYPLIMNQALLVGKICPVKGISYGEKYIIKTKDGLDTTKFIHPGSDAGKIKLKAYNKSIPDQEVEMSDIIFVCRVYWIVNPT